MSSRKQYPYLAGARRSTLRKIVDLFLKCRSASLVSQQTGLSVSDIEKALREAEENFMMQPRKHNTPKDGYAVFPLYTRHEILEALRKEGTFTGLAQRTGCSIEHIFQRAEECGITEAMLFKALPN